MRRGVNTVMPQPELITYIITAVLAALTGGAGWLGREIASALKTQGQDARQDRETFMKHLMHETAEKEKQQEQFLLGLQEHNHGHREMLTEMRALTEEFRDFNAMLKAVHQRHRRWFDPADDPAREERVRP